MEMPQPIDVNRLKGILGGAKAIMNKVETGDYEVGQVDSRALNEDGVQQMMAEGITRPQQSVAPQMTPDQPMYRNLESSKMPSFIKDAMVNTPIPQMGSPAGHTFNLEDVQEQTQQRAPQFPSTPKTEPRQPIYEQQQPMGANPNGTFTVSETALRAIVKDMLLEFMTTTFTKSLSEDVIKKTISTLIKEGKISVKKKTVKR
jgi:hypothetical protein